MFPLIRILCVCVSVVCGLSQELIGMQLPTTPKNQGTRSRQAGYFTTPGGVTVEVFNFCKDLLQSLDGDFTSAVTPAFEHFLSRIPYTMQNVRSRSEASANQLFYRAFAFALCHCIEQCSAHEAATYKTQVIQFKGIENDVIYLPLRTNGRIFVLQFFISDGPADAKFFRYISDNAGDEITVISINLILENSKYRRPDICERSNDGPIDEQLDPLDIEAPYYKEDHCYKRALLTISNPDLLNVTLAELYNTIPDRWHVRLEKFYQAIFANILTFVDIGIVTTEVPTWHGRADLIIKMPAYDGDQSLPIIAEFKFNHSAQMALDQIKDRDYASVTHTGAHQIGINVAKKPAKPGKSRRPMELCTVTSAYERRTALLTRAPLAKRTPQKASVRRGFVHDPEPPGLWGP